MDCAEDAAGIVSSESLLVSELDLRLTILGQFLHQITNSP